jgi:hypothetical protein
MMGCVCGYSSLFDFFVSRAAPPPRAARTKVKMGDYRGIYDIGLKRGF